MESQETRQITSSASYLGEKENKKINDAQANQGKGATQRHKPRREEDQSLEQRKGSTLQKHTNTPQI